MVGRAYPGERGPLPASIGIIFPLGHRCFILTTQSCQIALLLSAALAHMPACSQNKGNMMKIIAMSSTLYLLRHFGIVLYFKNGFVSKFFLGHCHPSQAASWTPRIPATPPPTTANAKKTGLTHPESKLCICISVELSCPFTTTKHFLLFISTDWSAAAVTHSVYVNTKRKYALLAHRTATPQPQHVSQNKLPSPQQPCHAYM
jgi:hypothetical protein